MNICECETDDSHYCIYIKGAPEKIWSYACKILVNGKERLIN